MASRSASAINAIEAVNLARQYGEGKQAVHVLKHINMTLPKG